MSCLFDCLLSERIEDCCCCCCWLTNDDDDFKGGDGLVVAATISFDPCFIYLLYFDGIKMPIPFKDGSPISEI